MRNFRPIFVLLIIVGQSCALLDNYKDNSHSWYANELTPGEKLKLDQGQVLTKSFDSPQTIGQIKIMKGNPKFGQYNFIEIGDWKVHYEFSSGSFIKGEAYEEVNYDNFGNILFRKVVEKRNRDNDFYTSQIWTSEIQVFDKDTVLTQKIVGFNRDNKIIGEITVAVLNHKEMLSDRLKTKIKVGPEKRFDDNGKLVSSTTYKFQDKVKFQ